MLSTFIFGKLPCVGEAVNPLILFPFSLKAIIPSPLVPIQTVLFLSITISDRPKEFSGLPALILNSDQEPFENFFNSLETPILVTHKFPWVSKTEPETLMVTLFVIFSTISPSGLFKLL